MAKRENLRSGFTINTGNNDYEIDRGDMPYWLESLADSLANKEKSAVEVSRERNEYDSITDQISSVISGKSKFSTVEDAVAHYQERTGLAAYLNQIHAGTDLVKKKASQDEIEIPELLIKFPEIKFFIDNIVKTRHGLIHIPAIQNDIADIYKRQGITDSDIHSTELMKYISDVISKCQSTLSDSDQTRMGDGVGLDKGDAHDSANSDAFGFATPVKL